jgi:hypothetical protein
MRTVPLWRQDAPRPDPPRRLAASASFAKSDCTPAQAALPQFAHLLGQLGWAGFVHLGLPDWSKVVVGGSSQGAGMALMVSQAHRVAASLQFAGVDDVIYSTGNTSKLVAAPWITEGNRAPKTPLKSVFGFSNVRGFCCEYWRINW